MSWPCTGVNSPIRMNSTPSRNWPDSCRRNRVAVRFTGGKTDAQLNSRRQVPRHPFDHRRHHQPERRITMPLPVKLSDVVAEMDMQSDEHSAYINRRTGEL